MVVQPLSAARAGDTSATARDPAKLFAKAVIDNVTTAKHTSSIEHRRNESKTMLTNLSIVPTRPQDPLGRAWTIKQPQGRSPLDLRILAYRHPGHLSIAES